MQESDILELNVDLGERSYPIYIGSGLYAGAARPGLLKPYIKGQQVAIVTNETIAPLYLDKVRSLLEGFDLLEVTLPDGEAFKNLSTLEKVFDGLLKARHTRKTTLIALGGGVVGDMTGFAAAAYQRGVDFIQIPTICSNTTTLRHAGKCFNRGCQEIMTLLSFHVGNQPETTVIPELLRIIQTWFHKHSLIVSYYKP